MDTNPDSDYWLFQFFKTKEDAGFKAFPDDDVVNLVVDKLSDITSEHLNSNAVLLVKLDDVLGLIKTMGNVLNVKFVIEK